MTSSDESRPVIVAVPHRGAFRNLIVLTLALLGGVLTIIVSHQSSGAQDRAALRSDLQRVTALQQELTNQLSYLSLVPGPQGTAGPAGATGEPGAGYTAPAVSPDGGTSSAQPALSPSSVPVMTGGALASGTPAPSRSPIVRESTDVPAPTGSSVPSALATCVQVVVVRACR